MHGVETGEKNDARGCFQAPMDQGWNKGTEIKDGTNTLVVAN